MCVKGERPFIKLYYEYTCINIVNCLQNNIATKSKR